METAYQLGHLPWSHAEEEIAARAARPCLRDETVALTYDDFDRRVRAAAEQFTELGVGHGSVIALVLPNRVELLIAMLAAWRLGAAATPVNPALTASEADYQISDAGSVLALAEPSFTTSASATVLPVGDLRSEPVGDPTPPRATPDDLALLVYTSGSTGRPKGVMLDHANLDAMTAIMVESMAMDSSDHCLLFLPLFHVNAICVSFLSPLRVGAQMSMLSRFSPDGFYDAVANLRPTYFSAVPTIYSMLLATAREGVDFSSVRLGICGAAPASKELLEATQERFGFRIGEGYGLTECTCAATSNPYEGEIKAGTVGPALPRVRVEVMSPTGEVLERGERGEVVISGLIVMRGYLNRPEATAETLRDGWLHTGDVGIFDEDGYLRIVDRIKDMIIRGGENLYPKEIENAISAFPGVMEVAVVGRPDAVYGEVPVAFIAGYPDADLDADALLEHCRTELARIKVPEIEIVDSIPKNPVGKLDKPRLRARFTN